MRRDELISLVRELIGEVARLQCASRSLAAAGNRYTPTQSNCRVGRWCLTNALITIYAMTLNNGPTRIVPGSHKWAPLNVPGENAMGMGMAKRDKPHEWAKEGDNIKEYVAEPPVTGDADKAPPVPFAPYPGEVVTVPARSIVFCNAHMWHSGTAKKQDSRRRQLHLSHMRRDMDQQLNQRAYPWRQSSRLDA